MSSNSSASRKLRGRPFQKGNPGRPRGARNKTTVALEAMLAGEAEAIVRKVVDLALEGDRIALRLAFDKIMGSRPERLLTGIEIPTVTRASDAAAAMSAILAAVAEGKMTPGEGAQLADIVASVVRSFEASEFDARIQALEDRNKEKKPW